MPLIHNRDCLEIFPTIPDASVDAIITDPPYSINTKSDGMGKINPWGDLCNAALWYREVFGQCRRILKPNGCMWSFLNWRSLPTFQKASMDLSWPIESLAIWRKEWIGPGGTRGLRPSYEMVALWCMPEFSIKDRGIPDIFSARWSGHKPHGHPAEKPEEAISWILDASCIKDGGVIMDPFAGSGTTAAVSVRRGYDFIGCEIDERHYDAACCRMASSIPPNSRDHQAKQP